MRTVTCINTDCAQRDVVEHYRGDPELVVCGVCQAVCELGELQDDPESTTP